jgi:iron complex outermembrane recepter protein
MNGATAESDDPEHQFLIQSNVILPGRLELGTVIRYIDKLTNPYVAAYTGLDIRLAWKFCKVAELNMVAQNILDNSHTEFIPSSPSSRKIERSIYGKIIFRL